MLIENDKIILIFSTHPKPWAFAIDSGRGRWSPDSTV